MGSRREEAPQANLQDDPHRRRGQLYQPRRHPYRPARLSEGLNEYLWSYSPKEQAVIGCDAVVLALLVQELGELGGDLD